ncbi:D-glycerate dehydrogenase [Clostridiaceae bacterium 35-E11]
MKKPKIYVTRDLPGDAISFLRKYCEVEVNMEDRTLTKEELLHNIQEKDGVLCQLLDVLNEEVLEQAKHVKVFANCAVGYNNIDVDAATQRGILITNTPGVLDDATADLTWALLFAAARKVPSAERYIKEGKFTNWSPNLFLGRDITGKTLGVIGAGRIGQNFARKAKAFGMKVYYYNRNRNRGFEEETGAIYASKEELLRIADFVTLHVPLTEETHHFIGEKEFEMMKKTAILINVARGPVVDEKALVNALETGQIGGAGLDVFENEPKVESALLDMENVVVTPHIGSGTIEARSNMAMMAAKNVLAGARGELPPNCLNPEALKFV